MNFVLALLLALVPFADETPQPKAENYESFIEANKKYKEKLFSESFWKEIQIIDKETKKVKKFSDLTKLQQHIFIVVLTGDLLEQGTKLQGLWAKEVAKFDDPKYKCTLTKEQVLKYCEELRAVRKEFFYAYKTFLVSVIEDFKGEITDPEKKLLMMRAAKMESDLQPQKQE